MFFNDIVALVFPDRAARARATESFRRSIQIEFATPETKDWDTACPKLFDAEAVLPLYCRIIRDMSIVNTDALEANDDRGQKLLFLLGPSASGKSYASKRVLKSFAKTIDLHRSLHSSCSELSSWGQRKYVRIDGGDMREASKSYAEMKQLVQAVNDQELTDHPVEGLKGGRYALTPIAVSPGGGPRLISAGRVNQVNLWVLQGPD